MNNNNNQYQQYQQNPSMEWRPVCEKHVAEALRTTLNWKAPEEPK